MSVQIQEVTDRRGMRKFIELPFQLHRENPLWVPLLRRDEKELFNPRINPSLEHAEVRFFLAEENGRVVGRVAAILSHAANQKYNTRDLRFGWLEMADNEEIPRALFVAVDEWGRKRGMQTVTGPMGFTDLDPEGMLVEGFDQVPTIASNHNPAYYPELMNRLGFRKEIDYVEFKAKIPEDQVIPAKLLNLAERIRDRSCCRIMHFHNRREIMRHGVDLMTLLDESFDEIYGTVPLTRAQKQYYVKRYAGCAHPDLIKAVVDEGGEMVAFMVAIPSMTRGFQRARGRLLPLGWWHIYRSLRSRETLDFYLAGVRKKYRGTGLDLLMLIEIAQAAVRMGFRFAESNLELETNFKIHAMWKYFNPCQHKRRRIFQRDIIPPD